MTTINDPDGKAAMVNDEGQLVTRSIIETELEHASVQGNAYSWDSLELDIAAGGTMLFVRNDSDTLLVLDFLIINGSDVICTWDVGLGEETTTPAGGTEVIGVNLNRVFSSKRAAATSRSDETAVADADVIARIKTPISGHHIHRLDGVILGKNHYIQINQETESVSGSVGLVAHYEAPE